MATTYLLIGDFTCWYIPAISDLLVYVGGIFTDSIWPSGVNELFADEWGEHTLPYISHEVSTFLFSNTLKTVLALMMLVIHQPFFPLPGIMLIG